MPHNQTHRLAVALLALIAANVAMIAGAVAAYPPLLSQPGARAYIVKPICVLAAYAIAIVWLELTRRWQSIKRTAALFGLLGGTLEILNIAIENGIPFAVHGPVLQIAFMLAVFASWGVAGFRAARSLNSVAAGVLAAVSAAGICMLIAVTGGFSIEFFLFPPDPAYVATWGEFQRSGWTDARAFRVANTLDAAFTHLLISPMVALLFGGVASWFGQSASSKAPPLR